MKNFKLIYILSLLPIIILLQIIGEKFNIELCLIISQIVFWLFIIEFLAFAVLGWINYYKKKKLNEK